MYCCPSIFSLTPPPILPKLNVQYIQTKCGCGGGGGGVELCCGAYFVEVLHSVSDQIQYLQNCFTTPTKKTSKDDIKGLVSLKFLLPWLNTYNLLWGQYGGGEGGPSHQLLCVRANQGVTPHDNAPADGSFYTDGFEVNVLPSSPKFRLRNGKRREKKLRAAR